MKFKHLFKKSSAISQRNYPQCFYLKNWLASLVIALLCFSCSPPKAQKKPKVAIVVWDGHAKEGQNIGTFRLYQLGDPTPGLKVKLKCEGTAQEGLDYRSLGLGTVQKINRYKDIHIRPIDDGLTEGTEEVIIRIVESEDYEIDKQYIQASFDILDSAFPDIEFEMPASVNEEAQESAEVKIKLSRPYEKAIELNFSVQGVLAKEGDDFKFSSNDLSFRPAWWRLSLGFRLQMMPLPKMMRPL